MDLDPKNLIRFIEKGAANTHTDLGPLTAQFDKVMAMSSTKTTVKPYPDDNPPNCHSGQQFDVFGAVMSLLKGLEVSLEIESLTKLDDYQTPLNIVQQPVPTDTDRTALYLIGPVGAPIVQNIVDQATLSFSVTNITNVRDDGFDLSLEGQLLNTGPFDAQIEFPEGVAVTWEGQNIAQISLPPICAMANEGVPNLQSHGKLKITNQKGFTKFATYILHNPSFVWTIHSDKLRVRALNIIFNDVKISKKLNFQAFNNLHGVSITSFDIPGETSNALKIVTGSTIPSPASLGIELDTTNFNIFFNGVYQGPVHSTNLFLAAKTTTAVTLNGFITHRDSQKAADVTGQLFSQYLQGKNSSLEIKGDSVVTKANGNKPVGWLTAAFKTLTLNVILPGHIYQVLYALTISDVTARIMQQSDTWAIPTSSNQSIATYANPLHFSLTPLKAALNATVSYQNRVSAQLNVPMVKCKAGTSHGPNDRQPIEVSFRNVPLVALDHANFQNALRGAAIEPRVSLDLKGTASLLARLVIGDIPISSAPFNITTNLKTLDSILHKATVLHGDVLSGNPDFLTGQARAVVHNPSQITAKTTGLRVPIWTQGYLVGYAILDDLLLVPGRNEVVRKFHYQPDTYNNTVVQDVLRKFIEPTQRRGREMIPQDIIVDVHGSPDLPVPISPFESLIPGLMAVNVTAHGKGIASRALYRIDAVFDVLTLFAAPNFLPYIYIYLTFQNDQMAELEFLDILNESRIKYQYNGPVYASFDTPPMTGCSIPPAPYTKVNGPRFRCPKIEHVLGNQGLIGSLPVIGQDLDVYNQVKVRIGGKNGYVIPALRINEYDVPTTYAFAIGDAILFNLTSAESLIDGILGNLGKLNPDDRSKITTGMKSIGTQGVSKLADNGLQKFVCFFDELSLDLLHSAGCNTTASSSSSSSGASSTGGASSSGSVSSIKVSAKPSSQANQSGSSRPQTPQSAVKPSSNAKQQPMSQGSHSLSKTQS